MPVTASNMALNQKTVQVIIGDETLNVTYYPNKVTTKKIAELDNVSSEGTPQALSSLIISWDMLADDGSMYPLDAESIDALGVPLMLKISQAIARDIRPN